MKKMSEFGPVRTAKWATIWLESQLFAYYTIKYHTNKV